MHRHPKRARHAAAGLLAAACLGFVVVPIATAQEDPPPGEAEEQPEAQPEAESETDPGAGPPATERRIVTETIGGEEIEDPYRWLEGDNSDPEAMGQPTAEVERWTDAQNAYTRSVLESISGRTRLTARLRELLEIGSIGTPVAAGQRVFYTARTGRQAQAILHVVDEFADGPGDVSGGEPRVLLDPYGLDPSGLTSLDWFEPSPGGALVAFGLSRGGDENSTLHVLDAETGRWLADEIPGKARVLGWMPGGRSFFYSRLAEPGDPYSTVVAHHEIGAHPREDRVLLRQREVGRIYAGAEKSEAQLDSLRTTWGPFARPSADGRWLTIGYYTGTSSVDLWAADLDAWLRTGELNKRPVLVGGEGLNEAVLLGDAGYLLTHDGAPNGRVVRFDPSRPGDREGWEEIVPERRDAAIEGIALARGVLVVTLVKDASTTIERYTTRGDPLGEVPLPGIGSAEVSVTPGRGEGFVRFESFDTPAQILRFDASAPAPEPEVWRALEIPENGSGLVVKRVRYTSADGTEIGMFVVHLEGLELDGNNPALLTGYGGFGISMLPSFDPAVIPWIERGGVFALPNIRGGGEKGLAWHEAGTLDRKQNVFDDFIAAAEWLIDSSYTRPERLAIGGRSNGGLLTGAAITQRPDLFSAAYVGVPLLDMLRYDRFLMARYWVPEYGSPSDGAVADTLLEYSPYHNIKPGTRYPAVLLTAGENDTRVHPMHARKMAARLQAATSADAALDPILLWVDRAGGHGAGKPLEARVRETVDRQLFLMWQTGMLDAAG